MSAARSKPPIVSDPFYPRLKALVIERTGMAFYRERDDDLARILGVRFQVRGVKDCASYLELLTDRAELEELIGELTIGETYFFRYREQFDALRDLVLPDVVERNKPRRRLRIWSAGCATGPEPYTVAIILKQRFGHLIDGWDVDIVGTDINQRFLARAREGLYDDWAFRATPDAMRNACFDRVGRQWRIKPEYRDWVRFAYHNLVDDPYPSLAHGLTEFDVILCRNVVIYFTTETFRSVLAGFRASLVEGGWLVVGHSELNTELFRAFRLVEAPGAVLYQKSAAPDARRPFDPPPVSEFVEAEPEPEPTPPWFAEEPPPAPPVEPQAIEPAVIAVEAPDGPDPAAELRALADQGAWLELVRRADKLIAEEPLQPLAHLFRGLALENRGDGAAAAEALRRAIYLDRSLALAHYQLGRVLREAADAAGAERSFRNAQRLVERADPGAIVAGTEDMTVAELAGLLRIQFEACGG